MSTYAGDIRGIVPAGQFKAWLFKSLVIAGSLSEMPFLDHLEELRRRILRALIAMVIATSICGVYAASLIRLLVAGIFGRSRKPV